MTSTIPPIINIRGELVALGPIRSDLIGACQRWFNRFETTRTQGDLPGPRTPERVTTWVEQVTSMSDAHWFVIYERATWRPIGITWLSEIDHRNGTAGFGISIGEEDTRSKGYGTETTRLMIDYALTTLGLHNLMLEVYAINPAGTRAYIKAGFHEIGRRREDYVMGGQRYDTVYIPSRSTG